MPRRQRSTLSRLLRDLVERAFPHRAAQDRRTQRRLKFESLEGRQLLAADLGSITGTVTLTSPVVGATINLYVDDGDGVFEPGAGDGAPTADLTDATGVYRFDRLEADSYWIEQPAQTVGTDDLGLFVKPLVTISAVQAEGSAGTVIDNFADTPAASVTADGTTSPNFLAADHAGALGGERDMIVTLSSGTTAPSVTLTSAGNQLLFDSSVDAQGLFNVIYDGNDNDAAALAATGLAAVDLTQSGANTSVKIRAQADHADATVRLRVYSDATNFSDSEQFTIPGTNTAEDFVFHFSQFSTAGGTGANFASVGALDLLIDTNTDATDGLVTLLGAFAPTVITQNFDNSIDLSITKTVNNATPAQGQNVTFTITVTNPAGGAGATGVVVTDLLPAGLAFVSSLPSQGTYVSGTGVWTVGSIAAGASPTLQIVATPSGTATLNNSAAITAADQPDPDPADNTAGESVTPVATADLSLTKDVNIPAPNLNSNVIFSLTLTNSGPDAATGVIVTDLLPAGLTFVSATPSGTTTYTQGTGVWDIGTVNSGASATLSITATVTGAAAIVNTAQVTASGVADNDSTPNNNAPTEDDQDSVTVDAVSADLSLIKDVNNPTPNLGQNVTFTLTLTNSGPDSATGVVVTDQLPAGLAFVSATASQGSYDNVTGLWNVGTVINTTPATLSIIATVNSTAALVNTAQVTTSPVVDPDSTPNNNVATEDDQDTATVDAPAGADLSLTKAASSNTPNFGTNVTFTLTVANAGPDAATGVVVTDLLPAGLVFVSSTPSQASYVSSTGVWTVGSINSAANATLAIVARVNTTAAVDNVAQVTASGVFDPDSTPNDNTGDDRDVETIDAPAAADLRLAKTVLVPAVIVGQQVTFNLRLDNDGPDAATGVTVTDQLPAGLTFVSATPSQGTFDNSTGVWTVGTVNNGANATLQIVATLTTPGPKTNTAQVTASNEFDPDSTPGDNTGDDGATVNVTSTRLSKRLFLAR